MNLIHLKINNLRNVCQAELTLCPQFNVFIGDNGSGKTSILEAIHYLSLGRSFRSHINSRVINYESDELVVFARLKDETSLGIEKHSSGKTRIRVNNDNQTSAAGLAQLLPLQLINPDTYKLLEGGSKLRRQFLDWGVFHVEPSFLDLWQRAQQILKQRNAALKQAGNRTDISIWDHELIPIASEIDAIRANYMVAYLPVFQTSLQALIDIKVNCRYFRGWDAKSDYEFVLERNLMRDRALGYTQSGPQRADLRLTIDNVPVIDVLSRGQQKLLVCAMRLAQGKLLQELTAKSCIYLVDDLAAELDLHKRKVLARELADLNAQVFITGVEKAALRDVYSVASHDMFHVEHGSVIAR